LFEKLDKKETICDGRRPSDLE